MSNATQIIKNNDLIALYDKIQNLDMLRLMRITKKSINLSRKDCFVLIFNYSKKFSNDKNYSEEYLVKVFEQAFNSNALYAMYTVFNDPKFNIEDCNLKYILENLNLNERTLKFLIDNVKDFSKINVNNSNIIYNLISRKDGLSTKNKKIIKLLTNNFGFNLKDFHDFLSQRKQDCSKFTSIYSFSCCNLFDFLKNITDKRNLKIFEDFFTKEDFENYKLYCLKETIKNF